MNNYNFFSGTSRISNDDYEYDAWKCDDENDWFFKKPSVPFDLKKLNQNQQQNHES